jgi:hypothetical protein
MRFWSGILFAILGFASCSAARRPANLAGDSANQIRILDIDCTATLPDPAVTNLKGRVSRLQGSSDVISGAISISNRNHAASVSSMWSGEVSGSLSEDPDEVFLNLTTPDAKSTLRRVQIRTGKVPAVLSTLSMSALPDIPMRCEVLRFSNMSISKVFPACNGAGTPTAGWYIDGRLVSHDATCANKVAACVSGQDADAWQIFTRTNRRAVIYSRCGGEQRMPQCEQAGTAQQGWYFRGQLLSADAQCHLRGISCEELGTKREGWYSHERLQTKQLKAATCTHISQQIAAPATRLPRTTLKTGSLSH